MRHLKIETSLFILALLLALGVRFYNLGAAPLTDAESEWALQALQVANPDKVNGTLEIGPQPAYVLLTSVMFDLFGASNFLARFWPALAGSLLALVPFYLRTNKVRRPLGRYAALILAFGLRVRVFYHDPLNLIRIIPA